jgi:hypothetical protein
MRQRGASCSMYWRTIDAKSASARMPERAPGLGVEVARPRAHDAVDRPVVPELDAVGDGVARDAAQVVDHVADP